MAIKHGKKRAAFKLWDNGRGGVCVLHSGPPALHLRHCIRNRAARARLAVLLRNRGLQTSNGLHCASWGNQGQNGTTSTGTAGKTALKRDKSCRVSNSEPAKATNSITNLQKCAHEASANSPFDKDPFFCAPFPLPRSTADTGCAGSSLTPHH